MYKKRTDVFMELTRWNQDSKRHVCGPDGESGTRTRSTVLMWMNGQYDVVEVENKDVGHLGNSKVAASWIISFFEGRSADQSFKILNVVDLLLDF